MLSAVGMSSGSSLVQKAVTRHTSEASRIMQAYSVVLVVTSSLSIVPVVSGWKSAGQRWRDKSISPVHLLSCTCGRTKLSLSYYQSWTSALRHSSSALLIGSQRHMPTQGIS